MNVPSLLSVLSTLSLAAAAAAQCPFTSVSLQTFGQGCTTVFLQPTTLGGSLDTATCTLGLVVQSTTGCCNTFLRGRLLAIGTRQVNVPLPFVGQGCTLLVDPVALLFLPSTGGDTFTFALPPTLLAPMQFEAQGAAIYTTFGVQVDLQLTAGSTVTLQ